MDYEENKPANQTKEEKEYTLLKEVYDDVDSMIEVCQRSYPEFNQNGEGKDRTLLQFIDDCQKRGNSYAPSRESQGKDPWQANVFTPTTRNKTKALIAGVAKAPPEVAVIATNQQNQSSPERAKLVKTMVEASFTEGDNNPETEMFFESWDCAIQGTVVELDDYIRIKNKVKVITDYDSTTGEVKFEEKEEYVCDQAVSIPIPLTSFFVWNPYVRDVQKQNRVAWIDYKDTDEAEYEFGEFKEWKRVKEGTAHYTQEEMDTFFLKRWQTRLGEKNKQYEVIRLYDKMKDRYLIVINGVVIFNSPLLWGRTKKKYPFSKTIYEPFSNSTLFWGNSLVNILMAEQDVENALINSFADKTYRSLNKPMLIGRVNRDNFDLEDEWVDSDTKIYVEDVSQVVPMPIEGVNNAEIAMLKIIQSGMINDSSDAAQSGQSGSGSTAREIVIANERAEELKGLFYTFMKDLWLQKYRLRALNLLSNYSKAKTIEVIGEDGEVVIEKYYKSFRTHNSEMSDGKKGTVRIDVIEDASKAKRPYELDVEETQGELSGDPMEIKQIVAGFLDEYEYGIMILTNNLFQKSRSLKMAEGQEEINAVATLFPRIFAANEDKFFKKLMEMYDDNPEKYDTAAPPPMDPMAMMGGAMPEGSPQAPQSPTAIQNQGMGTLPPLGQ